MQTFGGLVAAIGLSMLASRDRREASRVGGAAAVALTAAEIAFVGKGRIGAVYLADATLELGFAAAARALARTAPVTDAR